jgi:hypothetical protein
MAWYSVKQRELVPLVLYQLQVVRVMTEEHGAMVEGKTCLTTICLSATNPTWTALEMNPGLRGEKPGTDRLSHGMAK